uniref:RNA-dependent RNA polymerase n=1 Tax=Riboviria sp. TaxID=2585031 RepID=A0A8K1N5P6_9VIRU|nr:MAG: RNA-dependent RNA polymerase [Riboviria sp.]
MIKLPDLQGFAQRHGTSRRTPYLCFLDQVPEYTRSEISLEGIRTDLFQYHNKCNYDFESDPLMSLAVTKASVAFRLPPTPIRHICDVINDKTLDIWSSSPCLPWTEYGYKDKRSVVAENRNVGSIRKFWSNVKKGLKMNPPDAMAHARSHLIQADEPNKVRAVWGYPLTMVLGEAMFALPLIQAYKRSDSPLAYGYETAVGGCLKIKREFRGKYFTALDFSRFDKTAHPWLIKKAFDILEQQIQFTEYEDGSKPQAVGMYRCWDFIKKYFQHTTIRLANGERYKKTTGVPSGSFFTQLIDSIVNYIIITWVFLKLHGSLPNNIKVMGDDSICSSDSRVDLDDAQELLDLIGMVLNVKKSCTSRYLSNIDFLGYRINDGYPSRPYQIWLSSLAYPDFPDRCIDEFITRAIGLGYANACADDAFDALVRFIITIKPDFELLLGRHFHRWLRSQGIEHLDCHLPSRVYFLRKMGF